VTHRITKELENKSVVWFQNSNQYLVLEPMAASIVKNIAQHKELKEIAAELEKELDVPFEKAIDFVMDLEEKIITPNLEAENTTVQPPKNYVVPQTFETTKYYLINSKYFKVQFSNEFEVSLIHPKFAHLETSDVSEFDHIMQVFNHGNHTFLTINHELIGSWSQKDIHYFQGKFSMKIIERVYDKPEENWIGVFHASAVGNNENSILVLGDSGNGKSTALALLQAHGFHCIADDFVPVDSQKDVYSFPAGISIKKNSLKTLLSFYPELENSAEFHYLRLNKTVRYLPPSEISYHQKYPCKAFIFIKYDSTVDFEFEKMNQLDAFQNLIPDSWISQEPENVAIFLDWFSSLPCYQLTYSINDKMIDTVERILNSEL
jgi:hypothetical protein